MAKILVVYATDWGSTKKMAEAVAEGAKGVAGTEVDVTEATAVAAGDWTAADGVILGTPVHMGSPDWRLKTMIDKVCSALWMEGKAIGKVGAVFATGSGFGNGGGGAELAMLVLLSNLAELGMVLVPLPSKTPGYAQGGIQWGPYGRSMSDDMKPVGLSEEKLEAARSHGAHVARAAAALKGARIFG